MGTDQKWILVRVDGKLAAISQDSGKLAEISARIAHEFASKKSSKKTSETAPAEMPYREISATAVCFEDILTLKGSVKWEDLALFGTDFQKRVWKKLWELAYTPQNSATENGSALYTKSRLLSYSDFAELCENRAGVRPVAHAIALNPLPVIIPCHMVVPKEAIDRIKEIQRRAETTIFKGEDLCQRSILNDNSIDFGEYALGKNLKRRLISMQMFE